MNGKLFEYLYIKSCYNRHIPSKFSFISQTFSEKFKTNLKMN